MTKLLEEKQYFNFPKIGDLVKGKIISAQKNEIHIDLNGLATGIVRGKECYGESEQYRNLKLGDEVESTVLDLENENGEIELSFRYAGRQKAWQNIKTAKNDGAIIKAAITDANKGGLMINVENTPGFLPVSQLAPEHYPRVPGGDKNRILEILKSYVGKKFEVKIIDADENEDRLIVSEKAAWEETQKDTMNKYKIGSLVEGVVTAVTDFGVFVEFDDKLEGLVHISEIAWQRIDNPHDLIKAGQKVKTEIIGIEKSKIFLSMKKLMKDPWDDIEKRYKIGQKVSGVVLKTNPFGLFVELDKDIHGLAHISQLSEKPIKDINEFAKLGDKFDFYILTIEPKNHRLGLGILKPKEKKEKKIEKKEEKAEEAAGAKTEKPDAVAAKKDCFPLGYSGSQGEIEEKVEKKIEEKAKAEKKEDKTEIKEKVEKKTKAEKKENEKIVQAEKKESEKPQTEEKKE